ncbi:DUF6221 family protein [Streptomyces microflavus]|uniref:DUF6221 family protein n=1 Tax=Streptomyces microflavus TaxID=1919 RepID=UPI003B21F526
MDDLVQFLRDRFSEDVSEALGGADDGTWTADGGSVYDGHPTRVIVGYTEHAKHIARHDPARALRDAEANHQILDLHGIVHRNIGWRDADGETEYGEIPVCGLCVPKHSHYLTRQLVPEGPCATVRLLALPHANHPDYRTGWRP